MTKFVLICSLLVCSLPAQSRPNGLQCLGFTTGTVGFGLILGGLWSNYNHDSKEAASNFALYGAGTGIVILGFLCVACGTEELNLEAMDVVEP